MDADRDPNNWFEIKNSWFANNGWDQGAPGVDCIDPYRCWADGLTVHNCTNGYIHHNNFRDNTDIDLVVGGGSGCRVEDNTIEHILGYAFGGIHVGWFPGYEGHHDGSTFARNTISSGRDKLGFGVLYGQHPWDRNLTLYNASVVDNRSTGAVVNFAVDGTSGGEFQRNIWSNPQGSRGKDCLWNAKDYTASRRSDGAEDHAGGTSLQNGWVHRLYDNGGCRDMWP